MKFYTTILTTLLAILFTFQATAVSASDDALIHFFYFNADMPNNQPLEEYAAWYSFSDEGKIEYQSSLDGYPFTSEHANWRLASMERRNAPTSLNYNPLGNNNLTYNASDMRGMQVRNPFAVDGRENQLIFQVPSSGFENLAFRFAALSEGGADGLIIEYSLNGGSSWSAENLPQSDFGLSGSYELYSVDLSAISEANDNSELAIRIRFQNGENTSETSERVTFNNFTLTGSPLQNVIVYYSASTGSLASTQTWGTNTDGSGDNPPDFSSGFQTFVIQNRSEITLDQNWQVSGNLSRVTLGNGEDEISLTLPFTSSLTALLDMSAKSTLIMDTHFPPVFGKIEQGATVVYQQTAGDIPVRSANYYNLVLRNASKVIDVQNIAVHGEFRTENVILQSTLTSGRALLNLYGDLIFENAIMHASAKERLNVLFSGDKNQTIALTNSELHVYNFMAEKSAGTLTLDEDSPIRTTNHFEMHLTDEALFSDGGNTIFVNNSLSLGGETSAYNLTGTFWLTGNDASNNQNVRGNPNDNNIPIAAELNNLVIGGVQSEVRFRPNSGTENIIIKGDLSVNVNAESRIRFYENNIHLGGDFVFEPGNTNNVHVDDSRFTVIFNGSQNQAFNALGQPDAFPSVSLQKTGGIINLGSQLIISDSLHLESGVIYALHYNVMLEAGAKVTGGSDDSYIAGILERNFIMDDQHQLPITFPVGFNRYAPLIIQDAEFTGSGGLRVYAHEGPTRGTAGVGLSSLNDGTFWFIESVGLFNFMSSYRIALPFEDPGDRDRIVRSGSDNGLYTMIGGHDSGDGFLISGDISVAGYFTFGEAENQTYTADFSVTDTQGNPQEGAKIMLGEDEYFTDINGAASIENLLPNRYQYIISMAEKDTLSAFFDVTNANVTVDDVLSPQTFHITFFISDNGSAVEGAQVTLSGVSITTQSNGLAVFRLPDGSYDYMVTANNFEDTDGSFVVDGQPKNIEIELSPTSADFGELPDELSLSQNYPNPFNPVTTITYQLPQSGHVRLEVFDMLGRSVEIFADEITSAGTHTVSFDASRLSSGMYIYQLSTANITLTRKMMLIK